jgi:DNA-binding IclR family transcriptional regulator
MDDGTGGEPDRRSNPPGSVDNALLILRMLPECRSLRVAEVGRRLGVARSTAHRLLRVLQQHGFVEQDRDSRAYVAGPVFARLVINVVGEIPLVARPVMLELAEEFGETVHLSMLRGPDVLYLDGVESKRALRVGLRSGARFPAYASAPGRVMLARLSNDELHELFPVEELPPLTSETIASRTKLLKVLSTVREQGFAVSVREVEEDVTSIAVPIHGKDARVTAALSLSAPQSRVPFADVEAVVARLAKGADQIGSWTSS